MPVRRVHVRYVAGDRLAIDVGDHRLVVDQPVADGGEDAGPTPTELFIASLTSCMGFFAQRFLRRNGIDASALQIDALTTTTDRPHRVASIEIVLDAPGMDDALQAGLRRVVEHCTVHNALSAPPEVRIAISTTPAINRPLTTPTGS